MRVTIKKCLATLGIVGVVALYAAGAYRIELARMAPPASLCAFAHCSPTDATFTALR